MTNSTTVKFSDGREICLSYGVPVAAFVPGRGYLRRARRFSVTTSRHANSFAGSESPQLDETEFCALVAPLEPKR